MKLRIAILLTLVFGALVFGVAQAQVNPPPPSDDEVNTIAKDLYCPVCENVPLDVCGTQACAQWRDLIRQKLSEGWSGDQIKTYFVQQYGDRVLATPPVRGLNWLVYLVPPLAFLVGVFLLVRALRSWKAPNLELAEHENMSGEPTKDEYLSRLEEELKRSQ